MAKTLYLEEYVENGQERQRAVTCCIAFQRRYAELRAEAKVIEGLRRIILPKSKWIIAIDPDMGEPVILYCPHCGDKLKV